ncbi:MAG: hypothetical protein WB710_00260, partial [Stellaceae bacterium]
MAIGSVGLGCCRERFSRCIPPGVLEHLGRQLGCAPPRIASIRALYRRRRTLFEHQAEALAALGRTEPSEHSERGLVAHPRREAAAGVRQCRADGARRCAAGSAIGWANTT